MTALCAHPLIDRGELDLDATVAGYWPQFAAAGKQAVTIRQLLNHTAGLPAIREPPAAEAIFDWERMTSPLAAQQPWAELGTKMGYHSPAPQRGSGSATCRTRGCSVRAMSVRAASSRRSTRRSEPSLDALLVAEESRIRVSRLSARTPLADDWSNAGAKWSRCDPRETAAPAIRAEFHR